jgi:hypothetical protein
MAVFSWNMFEVMKGERVRRMEFTIGFEGFLG